MTGRRNKQELAGGVGHGKPYRILGTALGQLRKKRITFLPSKRRKNNDLVFSNFYSKADVLSS